MKFINLHPDILHNILTIPILFDHLYVDNNKTISIDGKNWKLSNSYVDIYKPMIKDIHGSLLNVEYGYDYNKYSNGHFWSQFICLIDLGKKKRDFIIKILKNFNIKTMILLLNYIKIFQNFNNNIYINMVDIYQTQNYYEQYKKNAVMLRFARLNCYRPDFYFKSRNSYDLDKIVYDYVFHNKILNTISIYIKKSDNNITNSHISTIKYILMRKNHLMINIPNNDNNLSVFI